MDRIMGVLPLSLLACLGALVLPASADDTTAEIEKEVWTLEESYIAAYDNADHERIQALLHERFLGWPDAKERPTPKTEVADFLEENYAQPAGWDYEIERMGMRIVGDAVLVHYLLNISKEGEDGVARKHITRITHTWIKEGDHWKILGGMSNVP
jgi:ketosteroid isomerase-like protein